MKKKVAAIISFAPLVGTIAGSQLQSPKKSLPLRPVRDKVQRFYREVPRNMQKRVFN